MIEVITSTCQQTEWHLLELVHKYQAGLCREGR